jgi:hypothetical protein
VSNCMSVPHTCFCFHQFDCKFLCCLSGSAVVCDERCSTANWRTSDFHYVSSCSPPILPFPASNLRVVYCSCNGSSTATAGTCGRACVDPNRPPSPPADTTAVIIGGVVGLVVSALFAVLWMGNSFTVCISFLVLGIFERPSFLVFLLVYSSPHCTASSCSRPPTTESAAMSRLLLLWTGLVSCSPIWDSKTKALVKRLFAQVLLLLRVRGWRAQLGNCASSAWTIFGAAETQNHNSFRWI